MRPYSACILMATLAILGVSIPARGQATRPPVAKPAVEPAAKVDLNTARVGQLETLPGVTPAIARAIIDARPLRDVSDLKRIKGITPQIYAGLADRVRVGAAPAPAAGPAGEHVATPARKVDLNTATPQELEELPGIGPARADQIVKARPFRSVEDLKRVKGISPQIYAGLADRVRVGAAPAAAPTTPPRTRPAVPATRPVETTGTGATPKDTAKGKKPTLPSGTKVNLNTATREELEALPGIGPARSEQILKARPFQSIEDIKKIKGIKDVEFGKIKDMITVK